MTIVINRMAKQTITKEEISAMEVEQFPGDIVVINSLKDTEDAVRYLSEYSMLGFDTETRPTFKKGSSHQVALVQLSTDEICFLFRLNIIGFPLCLIRLLANPKVLKIGLSLRDDFSSMSRRTKFKPQSFVDLQSIVACYDISELSLQKVYAILFGKKISKSQRLTNWEADVLTEPQQKYAALDAWACLKIYRKLTNQKK